MRRLCIQAALSSAIFAAAGFNPALTAETVIDAPAGAAAAAGWQDWSIHAQSTFIYQGYPGFSSPYEGKNSLAGGGQARETWSTTVFIGRKLWEGAELYANPELDQGFGFGNTTGLGGFSNGEAMKSGFTIPSPHLHRLFLRQSIGLGGAQETIAGDLNQFGGKRDVSRITFTAGKFSVTDMFNDNAYSHDPRTTFLNWAIWEAGAFDYPADKFGFTYGAVADLNQKNWALRAGYFLMPKESNSNEFDTRVSGRGSVIVEFEQRYFMLDRAGKLRLLGFLNSGYSGNYHEALLASIDLAQTRQTRSKYGFVINLEQSIANDFGLFSRLSWNDGRNEIMSFTDIDASLSAGISIKGMRWGRPNDIVGIAGAINALSSAHRDFIAAGGLGILIGDGALNYRTERIIEAYYSYHLAHHSFLTLDYQFIENPAYNADRGPVSILAVRLHAAF